MRQLTMMIGLPRSGKSTWVEEHKKEGTVIISADQFRYLMYGQRYYANGEAMMWATRDICLNAMLAQGVDIIVDETNITRDGRAKLIRKAKQHGYDVIGVFLDVPAEVCMKRAIATKQEDLLLIIDKMSKQLEVPSMAKDDFDRLEVCTLHTENY